jgi:hypothetical protein
VGSTFTVVIPREGRGSTAEGRGSIES